MPWTRRAGTEIKVGDVLQGWTERRPIRVMTLEPYNGPLLDVLGEGTRIASLAGGMPGGMTIAARSTYEVWED